MGYVDRYCIQDIAKRVGLLTAIQGGPKIVGRRVGGDVRKVIEIYRKSFSIEKGVKTRDLKISEHCVYVCGGGGGGGGVFILQQMMPV